ncbi:MAG: J domain-containing protein [Hyphomicrobiaceae bacterium]|nr:J domain-containing protein [Hyphomicrobiaceae bacterium]
MARDPYTVLGVERTASDDTIRGHYRKLAKELHPDLNPGDKAAEARFKEVSAAYAIIGDAEKRKQYDRGEIDSAGEPRRGFHGARAGGGPGGGGGRPFGDFPFDDIISDIFGGARSRDPRQSRGRGQDMRYTLEVEFLEAVNGAKKRVTIPGGGTLDLNVPAGVVDGQVLRLKGKGQRSAMGGEVGDALVEIKVRSHPSFRREGDDIVIELPVAFDEAALGAKIEVQTVTGRVQLTLPKGTSSGQVFRLKGKGVVNSVSGKTGDQLVRVKIMMPETIDPELESFLTEWRKTHKFDPGR